MLNPITSPSDNRCSFQKSSGILLGLLLAGDAVLLWHAMLHGFDPQDYGGFTNAAWRMAQGQLIYRDFHFLTVPVFMYFFSFFISILGFGKTAVYTALVLPTLAGISLTYFLAAPKVPLVFAGIAALLVAAGFSWDWPFPNYDIYSAVWILSAVMIFARIRPEKATARSSFLSCFLAGFFSVLALMTKTNEGGILGLVALVWIHACYPGRRREAYLGYAAGCWATGLVLLWRIGDFRIFYTNVVDFYISNQIGRSLNLFHLSTWLAHGYILPLLLCFAAARKNSSRLYRELLLLAGLTLIALFAYASGSNKHPTHMPLLGAITALAFVVLKQNKDLQPARSRMAVWAPWILTVFCVTQIALGTQVMIKTLTGQKKFNANGPVCCTYTLQSKPLNGWKVFEKWGPFVDQMVPYLKKNIPNQESLLILADMQILYPLTGHPAYPGVSFQFKVREQPQPGKQKQTVIANILANPPRWILTYKDNGPFRMNILLVDLGLENFLFSQYDPIQTWGPYILFRRKHDGT